MATIDSKAVIDTLIANKGQYENDPPVAVIVEYTNAWDKVTWGVTWINEKDIFRYATPTSYVRRPKVIWTNPILDAAKRKAFGEHDTPECVFCGKKIEVLKAVEEGWVPYFYSLHGNEDLEDGPACVTCAGERLERGEDGEWQEKRIKG